jgi:hypothetical protein
LENTPKREKREKLTENLVKETRRKKTQKKRVEKKAKSEGR